MEKTRNLGSKGVSLGVFILIFILILIVLVLVGMGVSLFEVGGNLWDMLQGIYLQIGIWLALIGIGVFLITVSIVSLHFTYSKWVFSIAKIGMILISLSLLVVIVSVLLPLLTNKTISFEECQELIDRRNIYRSIACVFVGYSPSEGATAVTLVNFIIVAIISPFVFFFYIFDDLMKDMKFPSDENARRVIAVVGAYSALRGALASYFVEFFTYGWFGMGALAFGIFMELMAWSLIKKFFTGIQEKYKIEELYDVLTGKKFVEIKDFLNTIASIGATYSWLASNIDAVKNFLTSLGYGETALELNRILSKAKDENIKHKHKYVSDEIKKLAG